jgi:hypothetical protein
LASAQVLNDANVALYPIDARGLYVNRSLNASNARGPGPGQGTALLNTSNTFGPVPGQGTALPNTPDQLRGSSMIQFAEMTGGQWFHDTNGLSEAIRAALDDSEVSYTLGFYPSHGQWDGRQHTIKVEVKREGVEARYRNKYLASAATKSGALPDRFAPLQRLTESPMEATGIELSVRLRPLNPGHAGQFEVAVTVAPEHLTFHQQSGRWEGSIDFLAGQYSGQGLWINGVNRTLTADMQDANYQKVRREGLRLIFPLSIDPSAQELRVAACDDASGAVGSVRIPLSKVSSAVDPLVAPPAYSYARLTRR